MRVHRAADIEKQQHFDRIAPLGAGFDIEVAMFGGGADGAVEVQFVIGAVAGPARRRFSATLMLRVPSSTVSSRLRNSRLSQTLTARWWRTFVLADAHAFGVVAIGAEGRGARGADPFDAALMSALLLLQTFFQRLHQFLEAAERLDLGLFGLGQVLLGHFFQPVRGQIDGLQHSLQANRLQPFECCREGPVEFVEIALVLHHGAARKVVKPFDIIGHQALLHGFEKREVFAQ